MSEQVLSAQKQLQTNANSANDTKKKSKSPENPSSGITRERSFVRQNQNHHHQHSNKRRSLAFAPQSNIIHPQQQQMRVKPALEIYRPPSMLLNPIRINLVLL